MVLLSHSIVDMQCKYQQADTKRTRTITEVIWYFINVKLQPGSKEKRKLQPK